MGAQFKKDRDELRQLIFTENDRPKKFNFLA